MDSRNVCKVQLAGLSDVLTRGRCVENDSPVSNLDSCMDCGASLRWATLEPGRTQRDGYVASGRSERTLRQLEVGKHGTENWISSHTGEFLTSHAKDSLGWGKSEYRAGAVEP